LKQNNDIKRRLVIVSASFVIFAIIVDVMLSMSMDVVKQLVSMYGVILFIGVTGAIYIPSLYLLLTFVNRASEGIRAKSTYFRITYKAVVISQFIIGGLLLATIIEIALTSKYSMDFLIASTSISFTLATIIMVMFSYRFFSWFRWSTYQKRKERKAYSTLALLLFYGIAGSAAAISIGAHDIAFNNIMLNKSLNSAAPSTSNTKGQEIAPQTNIKFSEISTNSLGTFTGSLYVLGLVILFPAFTLAWAGSAVLLQNYSRKFGRLKFWIIISLPLVLYIITVIPTVLTPSAKITYYEEPFASIRLINKLTVIAGSILFGIAFLAIGKSIQKSKNTNNNQNANTDVNITSNNSVKYYMFISAYGVMTFANLVATPVDHSTWPPFGLAASSFVSTASFLLSLGFYSSAVSVSQDTRLRKLIREYVQDQQQHMKFLDNIGTVQGEQEVQRRILDTLKQTSDTMEQGSGVQPSMTDSEIKDYLQLVLKEIETRADGRRT
jgi:hypothetical protein